MKTNTLLFLSLFLTTSIAVADGEKDRWDVPAEAKADQRSPNYDKTEQFLPGEEVVSPTGQKMKVWSTKGPVPVSRAPEPFEDREKSLLPEGGVVVDADRLRRSSEGRDRENLNPPPTPRR